MGATVSKWADLQESEYLARLVGQEPLKPEDPFWNGLFSVSVRRPSTRGEWSQFEKDVHPLIVSLAKNQIHSNNLAALVDVLLGRQAELAPALESDNSLYCWQLLNGLFVLRVALKGLIGNNMDKLLI